jgi:alkanesulfonate monooxygenase SsuD/methylene tetrahydromethanopterin reductase-like flavin-dependent oxidoreductase (luciferase family)
LDELAPKRQVLAMSTGDGALRSVGLEPATWNQAETAICRLREHAPPGLEVHVAASGPKGAAAAGRVATDLVLGIGLEPDGLRKFAERARSARAAAGVTDALRMWGLAPIHPVIGNADRDFVRAEVSGLANAIARFAFDFSFEDKAVPESFQPTIRERLAAYDFRYHGVVGSESPNSKLFDDYPEIQDYLLDRMLVIGTPAECVARVSEVARAAGLDGFWLPLTPSALVQNPMDLFNVVESAFQAAEVESSDPQTPM